MTKSTSNDLCRHLFENAADAILVLQDDKIVDFNISATALLGRKQLAGKGLLDFAPSTQPNGSSSVDMWQEKFNAAASQPQNFEWVFQPTKKRTIYTQISLSVLDFNEQTYAQLNLRNITHRKETKEELRNTEQRIRQSEQRLRAFVNALPDVAFIQDAEGKYLEVLVSEHNPRYSQLESALKGKRIQDVTSLEQAEQFINTINRALDTQEAQVLEYSIREGVWYEGRVLPISTDQGQVEQVVWLARDITDRKLAAERLRENEQFLQLVMDNIPQHIFWKDKNSVYLGANNRFAQVAGFEISQEIAGKTDYDLPWSKEEADFFVETDQRIMAANTPELGIIEPQQQADGKQAWLETNKIPLHDDKGNVVGILGTFEDITARMQLEEQVRESLTRREREVQISSQVSQEIGTITNEQELYGRLTTLIREKFDYYNTQLYRLDEDGNTLNCVAGYGEVGIKMLSDTYSISMGSGSVGGAAASGAAVLYRDVSEVANWQPNPYLPDTRAEIAVPIKLGHEHAELQATALQYFIDQNFDGVILTAIDPAIVKPIANQALEENIAVVTCTSNLGEENQTSVIWAEEFKMGYALGLQAGEWAKNHISADQILKVGVLNYRVLPQVRDRDRGIVEGIKDVFDGTVEVIGNETAVDAIQSFPITERWLKEHHNLHMVVAINDTAALGAYRAATAAGIYDPDKFFVGGVGAIDDALSAIESGSVFQSTVELDPREMGRRAVWAIAATLSGHPCEKVYEMELVPVNRTNIDDYLKQRSETDARSMAPDFLSDLNLTGARVGLSVISLTDQFFVALTDAAKEEADRLGIELVISDPKQVLGVLAVQSDKANIIDVDDLLSLEGVAGQIAVALENLRLLDEASIFRQFAEATGQGLSIANLDGSLIYINPTLGHIVDIENLESLAGKNLDQYYSTEMQLRIQKEVLPAVMESGQWVGELALRATNGKVTPTIENFFIIYDDNNQPRYIADLITDITDRKQAETELETRLQELDVLQRLMSREGWEAYQSTQETETLGYLFDKLSVLPVETVENGHPAQSSASGNGNSLSRPVSVHGQVIGALGIYDDPEDPIKPEDREFLDTIAEQVAEAMERARLLEQSRAALSEVEQSQAQTERLYQANRRLSAAADLQEAVAAVIEGVSAPDIDRGVLIIFERNSAGEIEFGNVEGNWHDGVGPLPTPVGTHYPIEVIQTLKFAISKDPFFFNDTFNDERVDPGSIEVFRRQEIRAVAALPLWTGNIQLGTLLVESSVPHIFTQAEIEPFISLVAQLTVTVENRRLFEQTQATLAEIEATQRRYTVQAWESYRTRTIKQNYEQTREGVVPLGEEIPAEASQAVARKQAITKIQQPALTAGDENAKDGTAIEAVKSSLAVPLTVRNQIIGVLGLQETNEPREWLPEEIALVEAIAEQMAQAAENIRLLDDTQQRAAREQRVNEIGDKIQGAQSLEEALQIAVKEVGQSLEAPETKVKLSVD